MPVLDSLHKIHLNITRISQRSDRNRDNCTLLAVSKTRSYAQVLAVHSAGQNHFAENRVQEALDKFPTPEHRPNGMRLHLIGPLQTNKARQAMAFFDGIQTLDRPKLAQTLARLADETGHCPALMIQVNTGAEPQKAGVLPDALDDLVSLCRELTLPLRGLMCIPPSDQAPAPHFAWLATRAADLGLAELSMGMSGDYEAAVELGATCVRIGSAIFADAALDN